MKDPTPQEELSEREKFTMAEFFQFMTTIRLNLGVEPPTEDIALFWIAKIRFAVAKAVEQRDAEFFKILDTFNIPDIEWTAKETLEKMQNDPVFASFIGKQEGMAGTINQIRTALSNTKK